VGGRRDRLGPPADCPPAPDWLSSIRGHIGACRERIAAIDARIYRTETSVGARIAEVDASLSARIAETKTDLLKWVLGALTAQTALLPSASKLL
jgi:hypothetical protein